jgi:hypothetical protein
MFEFAVTFARLLRKEFLENQSVLKFSILATIPALSVLFVYELFLGHRHDYAGHYAAGYGATFLGLMFLLRNFPANWFPVTSTCILVPLCVVAILAGAIAEATAFNIAKFDEIDFCNQSLGAVLATIVASAYTASTKPPESTMDLGLLSGIIFLSIGGVLAVA